ncbi:MAG: hypothetical protein R3F25_12665 [Gammaproteobacteria bacterium]|jgi:hypothetical protein|nr:hypothetical protein [Xanthomonadales bacterium]
MKKILIFLLLILSGCVHRYSGPNPEILSFFELSENDLLLVVKVTKSDFTGLTSISEECQENPDCIPWSYWYVYDGKILDNINKLYQNETIRFAFLSHADYLDEIKREWYVHLRRFKNIDTAEKLKSKYFVVNHSSEYSIKH